MKTKDTCFLLASIILMKIGVLAHVADASVLGEDARFAVSTLSSQSEAEGLYKELLVDGINQVCEGRPLTASGVEIVATRTSYDPVDWGYAPLTAAANGRTGGSGGVTVVDFEIAGRSKAIAFLLRSSPFPTTEHLTVSVRDTYRVEEFAMEAVCTDSHAWDEPSYRTNPELERDSTYLHQGVSLVDSALVNDTYLDLIDRWVVEICGRNVAAHEAFHVNQIVGSRYGMESMVTVDNRESFVNTLVGELAGEEFAFNFVVENQLSPTDTFYRVGLHYNFMKPYFDALGCEYQAQYSQSVEH